MWATLNLNGLSQGLYIVEVQIGNRFLGVKKIVKKT
jgi:hypothetical protein